jgi:hypothetical protein
MVNIHIFKFLLFAEWGQNRGGLKRVTSLAHFSLHSITWMMQLRLLLNRDNKRSLNRKIRKDLMPEMLSLFAFHFNFSFLVWLKRINRNHITRQTDFPDTRHDFGKASAAIDLTVAGTRADVSAVA